MVKRHERSGLRAWLVAGGMTAALWLFLSNFSDIHFGVNDDQFILRTFMGFEPGGAPTFHLYIHGMYAYPLRWLSLAFPKAAWFSVLEIGLLSLGLTTILKSIFLCFQRRGSSRWLGYLFGACYLVWFGLFYCARVTYTTTAATLGAAAVAQMLSVNGKKASDREIIGSMAYALTLVALCYGLRQMTALPVLGYCGLVFLLLWLRDFGWGKKARRSPKPLLITLCAVGLVMGGLAAGREAEITAKGQRDYLDWQQARISVLDYIDLERLPKEALQDVGWTEKDNELLIQWNTMDEKISTESFRYLRENWRSRETSDSAGMAIEDFRTRSPLAVASMLFALALGLIVLAAAWGKRKEEPWSFWTLLAAGGFCFAFFCYLALQGRLPYRAVMVPVMPAAAMVFCLAGDCLPVWAPKEGKKGRVTAAVCAALVLATTAYSAPLLEWVRYVPSQWEYNTGEDMDAQALSHPELLLIYSTELVNDMRMFPNVEAGTPTNLMFWGGWQRGAPEYKARLEAFGIDPDHFTASDWLRPEVRFLSLKEEPNQALLDYLRENLGAGVNWEGEKVSQGLWFYRFYIE